MGMLDFIEVWTLSIRAFLELHGIVVRFERTTDDRPKASCVVNFRRGASEADLIVWESGEADLTIMDAQGTVVQQHFDGISGLGELTALLARLLSVVSDR